MDMLSLLRTLGGLGVVLGVLAGALWVVRRYDLRLPGRAVGARKRRLELVESLQIDSKRIVALVRHDGQEHLVLIAPEGHLLLETSARLDAQASAPDSALAEDTQPATSDTVHAATESFVSSLGKLQREGPSDDIDIKSVIERLRRSASTSRALPLTLERPVRRRAQAQVRQPLPFERERQLV